jgi:choline-sulfatase
MADDQPNVLFLMTDQQRFDAIGALNDGPLYTPNLDRLVESGVTFTNAYSQCPVCVPARYNIRTGREPSTIEYYGNNGPGPADETPGERAGGYLGDAMQERGYRTFSVGKSHTSPKSEDIGYETHLRSEELYGDVETRKEGDAYGRFLAEDATAYDFLEQPHGERSEMYFMPQLSPLPAEVTVENWAAEQAIDLIHADDDRPFFGMVSFIGPHPPLAPPIPFNRLYSPDDVRDPIRGERAVDHMDEQIPYMNYKIWAHDEGETVDDLRIRTLRARYYGEVTYIDQCVGRILDALEAAGADENTLICHFSDHGEHLGDHHAWQKESFFEQSARIPFVVRWPGELPAGERRDDLVCLTDLFGAATAAAGDADLRDGVDLLGLARGDAEGRDRLVGFHSEPGTRRSKFMLREGRWKYIYMANGGREQLFDVESDPHELEERSDANPDVRDRLRATLVEELQSRGIDDAVAGDDLWSAPFEALDRERIHQMAGWKGVHGFPDDPATVVDAVELGSTDAYTE